VIPGPGRRDQAPRHGPAGPIRQRTEPANDTLKGQPDPERHGGRTTEAVHARTTRTLPATATATRHNRAAAEPVKSPLTAHDH
jgi:hypothetical protein